MLERLQMLRNRIAIHKAGCESSNVPIQDLPAPLPPKKPFRGSRAARNARCFGYGSADCNGFDCQNLLNVPKLLPHLPTHSLRKHRKINSLELGKILGKRHEEAILSAPCEVIGVGLGRSWT
jgi:hypothetical protein